MTVPERELVRSRGSGALLMVDAGAVAPWLVPADRLLDPSPEPGAERAPVVPSEDRTHSSSERLPHTTGRTP
jgi:hypothetical protein